MTMLDSAGQIKPLVERLRQIAQEGREIIEPWQLDPHLYDEAADEIERLRAAIVQHRKTTGGQWCAATDADAELYRALEQRGPSDGNA